MSDNNNNKIEKNEQQQQDVLRELVFKYGGTIEELANGVCIWSSQPAIYHKLEGEMWSIEMDDTDKQQNNYHIDDPNETDHRFMLGGNFDHVPLHLRPRVKKMLEAQEVNHNQYIAEKERVIKCYDSKREKLIKLLGRTNPLIDAYLAILTTELRVLLYELRTKSDIRHNEIFQSVKI